MTGKARRCLIKILNKVELIDTYWTPSAEYRGYTFHLSTHGAVIKLSIHRNLNKFPEVEITEQGWWWKYITPGAVSALSRLKGSSSAWTVVNHSGTHQWVSSLNADSVHWAQGNKAEIHSKPRKRRVFTTTKPFTQVREEVQTKLKPLWKTAIKNTL